MGHVAQKGLLFVEISVAQPRGSIQSRPVAQVAQEGLLFVEIKAA